MEILKRISERVQQGEDEGISGLIRTAIEQGHSPREILDRSLIGGMNVVGERFRVHEIFLPEVLLAARAMEAGVDELRPLFAETGVPMIGKIVIGTVQGDLHDIGKNLVSIMLRGAGYEVIDLGNDVAPGRFLEVAEETGATIIGMSALLTTTMPGMKKVIAMLEEQGLSGKIRTIVGGAPVSADFARDIGADAYAYDAANAVARVKALVG